MSYKLDPRIASKLDAFARRRRKLIILRGAAAALGMLLATMLIVAAVDFYFVLPDEARWGMSALAYLAVIIAEWRTCLRLLAHTPNPTTLARLVEHAEPKLREDLISAVELGSGENERVLDSPQFRELVQEDVAGRMEGLQMERLLPVNLVRRYLAVASVLVLAVALAFVGTGFQLSTLMLRALFPGANLGRVSRTQVEIIGPNPAEMLVPFGDAVPLLVKISGASAREAWLETFTAGEGRQKVKLTPVANDQFAGAIQVSRQDLRYRVRAGDAITRKYLLDAEPRPHVARFTKTFTPPAYTKSQPRTVSEENGDLIALEGTTVDLTIETNQPIKQAELRVDQAEQGSMVLPLNSAADGKLTCRVQLSASGTYRVHLVGAVTGFENKFSPEYELRADPDLIPEVEIDQPKQDLIVPANDLLDLVGHVSDDQGIARVEQHIRVNDHEWKSIPLLGESGKKANIVRRWDLYEEGAKAGDLITTKFVAFDLKGSRGESRALQITVTSAGVEMKRLESLTALVNLEESLKLWRASIDALAKACSEARQKFEQAAEDEAQRVAAIAHLNSVLADFDRQHAESTSILTTALRAAQQGHQAADLVLLGRLLTKIEAEMARPAKISAGVVAGNPAAPYARELMRDSDDAANRAAQRARGVEENFRTLLNSEEADLLAENSQVISREQQRLAESARTNGDDATRWAALGDRIGVVVSETKSLEDILSRLEGRGSGGSDRVKQLAKELKRQREAVEKAIRDHGINRDLLAPAIALAEALTRTAKGALDLRQDLARKPVQAVRDMRQDVGPTWANFEKLSAELSALNGDQLLADEARTAIKDARWRARGTIFKANGDLEELRPLSDPAFVSDLRSITLALDTLHALVANAPPETARERLSLFDHAFRILEGAHDLQEIHDGLGTLATAERWQVATPRARTVAPRDWDWLEVRLQLAPEELGKLDPTDEAARSAITEAQRILREVAKAPAFRSIDREMGDRRRPDHVANTSRVEAENIAAEVSNAIELLRPHVEAARQMIANLTPKLSDFAMALAKEAEQLKKETQEQEESAKEKSPDIAREETRKTLAEQQNLDGKLDALRDLLRADANQQDILQKDQRERARDSDDAIAMLKDPPPKAENALKEAAESQSTPAQEQSLAQAVEQQQKLENALNQIARHFEKLEQGSDPGESRMAMRAAEEELGIKQALDEQFAKAEQIAKMSQSPPEELLKQLEQALPQNPEMQQELSSISQNTLTEAEQNLSQASRKETETVQNLSQLKKQEEKGSAPQNTHEAALSAEQAARLAAQAAAAAKDALRAAEETAKKGFNQPAATQANRAADFAKAAAQMASQAAQSAQQMTQRTEPVQIKQAAEATMARAAESARNAQQAADLATEAQKGSQEVADRGFQQENNQQSADRSAEAMKSAKEAAESAREAEALARQAAALVQAPATPPLTTPKSEQTAGDAPLPAPPNPLLAQAARQQPSIAQSATQAGGDVSRAGRHEARLQNSSTGERLQQLGSEISETGTNEVPSAQAALEKAKTSAEADQSLNAAAQELAAEAAQLRQAAQGGSVPTPPQPNGSSPPAQTAQTTPPTSTAPAPNEQKAPVMPPSTPQEQVWMARTLDALDALLNNPPTPSNQDEQSAQNAQGKQPKQQGQPSQNGQQQQQSPAQTAMQQAARATQQAMQQARAGDGKQQGGSEPPTGAEQQKSLTGANAQSGDQAYGATPDARGLKRGDWGKLPKQVAEQLTRGQGETVPAEYRSQVETYYRVIAERAKKP